MRTAQMKISGMDRTGCANVVKRALEVMGGVRSVRVSFPNGEASVEYDERITSPEKLKLAVMGAGYGVESAMAA